MSTLAVMTQLPSALTVVEATGAARTWSSTTLSGAPTPPTTKAPSLSPTRTLLICGGTDVAVAVGRGVEVSVAVSVGAGVGVSVEVSVGSGVAVGVSVAVSVAIGTGVEVSVGTGVSVAVLVGGMVAVAVGSGTGVSVLVAVGSVVAVLVGTGVGVGRSTTTRSSGTASACVCVNAPDASTICTPMLEARVKGSAASMVQTPVASTVALATAVSSSTTCTSVPGWPVPETETRRSSPVPVTIICSTATGMLVAVAAGAASVGAAVAASVGAGVDVGADVAVGSGVNVSVGAGVSVAAGTGVAVSVGGTAATACTGSSMIRRTGVAVATTLPPASTAFKANE